MFNFEIARYRAIIKVNGIGKSEAKDFYFFTEAEEYITAVKALYKRLKMETTTQIIELEQPETTPELLNLKRESLETEIDHLQTEIKRAMYELEKAPNEITARNLASLEEKNKLYENELKTIQQEIEALNQPEEYEEIEEE